MFVILSYVFDICEADILNKNTQCVKRINSYIRTDLV
ncbi:hypothetical protein ACVW2L_001999 [Mucilaginibacter sp. HD30]